MLRPYSIARMTKNTCHIPSSPKRTDYVAFVKITGYTLKDAFMSNRQPIAHAATDKDGAWRDPHDLAEHLRAVASLASRHAHRFNGSDWAHLAGLWHDLGKYRLRFQHYIRRVSQIRLTPRIMADEEIHLS